jgi:NitT/TauT family transport system substrate-binding protein
VHAGWIARDPKGAAETYLTAKEKISVDELVGVIKQPGSIFSATPQRSMLWANDMHRIGLLKAKPASWKDFSFPAIHDRAGSRALRYYSALMFESRITRPYSS